MPNWCENKITIGGNRKMISILTGLIKKHKESLFKGLVGINPFMTLEEYKTGDNWFQANCNWWGCKWDTDIDESLCTFEDEYIYLNFETAWSPPVGFCKELAKKYKVNVEVTYYEPGMNFAGMESFEAVTGIQEIDESYTVLEGLYRNDKDRFWADLDYELEFEAHEMVNNPTAEELVARSYSYVSDDEKETIIEMYNKKLTEVVEE